ncbi:hypothetical protein CALK_0773 [Chitinivibrio alkaliphilus ACht1]|uniref:Uncharacterized protein n=1 Tax=Chitinivibrio alkaliphilus ACht1 TaxID=1313304 RepID=U7D8M6_9BACT|nr:hypothetical protein CALK_0773 [Chitinivibrio alkaliphilus ACht1]
MSDLFTKKVLQKGAVSFFVYSQKIWQNKALWNTFILCNLIQEPGK